MTTDNRHRPGRGCVDVCVIVWLNVVCVVYVPLLVSASLPERKLEKAKRLFLIFCFSDFCFLFFFDFLVFEFERYGAYEKLKPPLPAPICEPPI